MIPIIDPEEDYLTIASAEEQMTITEHARQKELHEAHSKMRGEHSPEVTHDLNRQVLRWCCSFGKGVGRSARVVSATSNHPVRRSPCCDVERARRDPPLARQSHQRR